MVRMGGQLARIARGEGHLPGENDSLAPLAPYSRTMLRALRWSQEEDCFL